MPTLNKPQGMIAASEIAAGYRLFISKEKWVHLDNEEYSNINILRETWTSQSLLTQMCLPRWWNSATRKQDTVKVEIINELPMLGVDLLLGNDLAGSSEYRIGPNRELEKETNWLNHGNENTSIDGDNK